MTDYKPLLFAFVFALLFGVALPWIINDIVDVSTPETNSFLNPLINFSENGARLFEFDFGIVDFDGFVFNPYSWLGEDLNNFFTNSLIGMSYIPDYILVPLIILLFGSIIYGVIKLMPFT